MTHHKVALVVLASLVLACGGAKPNADGGAGGGQGGGEAGGGAGGGTGGGAGGGAGGGGGEIDAGSCTPGDQQVCHNVNSNGSCPGISTCDSNASWSQCVGQVPAKDICDGVDNDCDGTIDNPKFSCTCPGGVQVEICTNQKDDDCDGMIDCPGEPTAVTTYGPSVNGEQPIFCGFGSCNLDNEVDCLAISKSTSGLFIAGGMTGHYDFLGTGNPIGVDDAGTGFLVRLDPLTRAALWQKQLPFVGGGLSFSKTTTFTSPSTGALYVSGAYQHGFSFGGAITGEPDAGDVRLAVLKVSPQTGDPLAGTFFGSPDGGFERQALFGGETADGGLMIAGTFMGSMAQVGGPALPGFGGFGDGFVAELAPGLELRDMRTFGSPGLDSVDSARVNGGKLWVSGRATGAFTFGDAGFGGSGTYGFLFGYDTATHGVPLALSTSAAGEVTSVVPGIGNIAVFAAGYTQGSSTLGGCNVNPNNVNSTLFVAALDAAGGCVWVRTIDNGQVQQASVVLSLSSGNDALTAMGNGGTLGPGFTLPDGGLGNTASTGGATVWYATFVPATGTATSFFHDSNIGSMTPNAAADDFFCGQYGDAYGSTQKFPFSALPQSPSATSSFLTPINR